MTRLLIAEVGHSGHLYVYVSLLARAALARGVIVELLVTREGRESDEFSMHLGDLVSSITLVIERESLTLRGTAKVSSAWQADLENRAKGCRAIEFVAPLPGDSFMEALAAADVLLVNERPSLREAALPSKLTTYFVTGRPVLAATDSASTTADEIRASRAGRIVAPEDPEALAMAALSIAREWTAEDSQAGPAHVERALSERVSVAQFESLLMAAVTKNREFVGRERVR